MLVKKIMEIAEESANDIICMDKKPETEEEIYFLTGEIRKILLNNLK